MPPNATQNLNAKLSLTQSWRQRDGGPASSITLRPIHSSAAQNKILGGARRYRGGYHLNV